MKVMVIGGAGMLGHQMFLKLQDAFGPEAVGCTLRKSRDHYKKFGLFSKGLVFDRTDVTDFSHLQEVLCSFQPTAIVNCVGLTLRKPELGDFERCLEVNAMVPHWLAKWGEQNGARVLHFSTDCVFDGKKGNYRESDLPTAKDLYGRSKFLGEILYPNSVTLRLSIVGRELEAKTELIEWFLSQKGKSVKGYSQVRYSGLTTNVVADEVIRILRDFPKLHGVYQVSSEPISKFELLRILNEVYQTKTEIVPFADAISDKTLNCDLYSKATGFKRPQWQEMLMKMKQEERVQYD